MSSVLRILLAITTLAACAYGVSVFGLNLWPALFSGLGFFLLLSVHFRPPGEGPAPGALYLHEIYGLFDAYREDARELASRGYLVFLPDLYSDAGKRDYCVRALVRAAGRRNSGDNPLYREISDLIEHLATSP